jgi:hypothetical protein
MSLPWRHIFCRLRSGWTNNPMAKPADELTDPLVARLAGLVLAQGFLAAQVQCQMAALHFRIGLELGQNFASDGRITADALVKTNPSTFFLRFEDGAPRTRTGFLD